MKTKNIWLYISVGGLVLSVVTLFLSVIKYISVNGERYSYNLVDFLAHSEDFRAQTLAEYTGSIMRDATAEQVITLIILITVIGVLALVFSVIGIVTLSQQKKNIGPFIMALLGAVGTAIPAITLLVLFALSGSYFEGTLTIGAYAIVTPIAMICTLFAVTYKRKATLAELEAKKIAETYLKEAKLSQ